MKGATRSQLFLSCDLVNSTSYKQQTPGWQGEFLSFYRQFPQSVGDLAEDQGVALQFDLWKPIGDELIFTVVVRHERHVFQAVRVWLAAMESYETQMREKQDKAMGLKGSSFIATFPGPDSESSVPRNPASELSDEHPVLLNDDALKGQRRHTKYLYDYFGPSIDTGFRVASQATPRHFTVSVEVALAMLLASREDKDMCLDDLVFRGPATLKGVWGGRDYPMFAIDRHHDDDINRAMKRLTNSGVDEGKAIELCRECVTSEGWMSAIYLPDSGVDYMKVEPADSLEEVRKQASVVTGVESVPAGDPEQGTDLPDQAPLGRDAVD